jgi:hypothetical protein
MSDAPPTPDELEKMLERLPRDEDAENVTLRLRLETQEGRTIFGFVRAGVGAGSFAGWEARSGMTGEEEWDYFVLAAEKPGAPIQVINREGPLGIVVAAELEDRGK